MSARRVRDFVDSLAAVPSTAVLRNPYRLERCRENLTAYLRAMLDRPGRRYLLVGEAPGWRGCAITGIPFTDERMLKSGTHPFLVTIRPLIKLDGRMKEATAHIVWSYLNQCDELPAFWNAVPFHPCLPDERNRAPTNAEIELGLPFLKAVHSILDPDLTIAVGKRADAALEKAGVEGYGVVRHPSNGGKTEFCSGLARYGIVAR
jgi:uracil-DNA glycosylase